MLFEEIDSQGKLAPRKWSDLTLVQKGVIIGTGVGITALIISLSNRPSNIQQVPVNPDLLYYETQQGNVIQWNPDILSKEIYENFEGWNLYTYPETTDKILQLNDEQIKKLYNHYNQYYAEDEPTLTQLLYGEWGSGTYYSDAIAKLKSLGLN